MNELQSLALYTGAILAGALAGGALPLLRRDRAAPTCGSPSPRA